VNEGQKRVSQQPSNDEGQLCARDQSLLAYRRPIEADPKPNVGLGRLTTRKQSIQKDDWQSPQIKIDWRHPIWPWMRSERSALTETSNPVDRVLQTFAGLEIAPMSAQAATSPLKPRGMADEYSKSQAQANINPSRIHCRASPAAIEWSATVTCLLSRKQHAAFEPATARADSNAAGTEILRP